MLGVMVALKTSISYQRENFGYKLLNVKFSSKNKFSSEKNKMITDAEVRKILSQVYYKLNDEILAFGFDKCGKHNLEEQNSFYYRKELGNFVLIISLSPVSEWDYDINYLILDEFVLFINLYNENKKETLVKFLYFKSAECEEILNLCKSIIPDLLNYMEKLSLFDEVANKFIDYERIEKMRS